MGTAPSCLEDLLGGKRGPPGGASLIPDNPRAGRLPCPHSAGLTPRSQPHTEHWEQMFAVVENPAFDTCHAQHGPCLPQGCGNVIPRRSQYQTHASRNVFVAANEINKTDIPVLRMQELNSLQQVPSPTQLWDSMLSTKTPNPERGTADSTQNDPLEMLHSRVTHLGTSLAPPPTPAPSASHRHPDGHPVTSR